MPAESCRSRCGQRRFQNINSQTKRAVSLLVHGAFPASRADHMEQHTSVLVHCPGCLLGRIPEHADCHTFPGVAGKSAAHRDAVDPSRCLDAADHGAVWDLPQPSWIQGYTAAASMLPQLFIPLLSLNLFPFLFGLRMSQEKIAFFSHCQSKKPQGCSIFCYIYIIYKYIYRNITSFFLTCSCRNIPLLPSQLQSLGEFCVAFL